MVGQHVMVGHGAMVGCDDMVGDKSIYEPDTMVAHDAIVGDFLLCQCCLDTTPQLYTTRLDTSISTWVHELDTAPWLGTAPRWWTQYHGWI